MKNYNISTNGFMITDEKDKIIFHNDLLLTMLKEKILLGRSLSSIQNKLKDLSISYSKMQNHTVFCVSYQDGDSFFNTIMQGSLDEIFVTDSHGITLFCNDAFESNYGMLKSEILGKNVSYLVDTNCADKSLLSLVLETKRQVTYEQKTKPGKIILNTSTPVFDEHGDLQFVVENCRDITEINKLKSTLFEAQEEIGKYKNVLLSYTQNSRSSIDFKSQIMKDIYKTIDNMANKNINMLLLGKSGTGKNQLAKRIHEKSERAAGPFVTINCSTIPENLMESELFGYLKGSFTGASSQGKIGLIEKANQGTLFLDEIGELPLALQVKLLEVVQEKTYLPIGETKTRYVDARIIAATNRNIFDLVNQHQFREDLYYRLAVVTINVPSLKDRPEDVALLLKHYLIVFNEKHQTHVSYSKEVFETLLAHSWPGNIRELEHLVEFLVLNAQSACIQLDELPTNIMRAFPLTVASETTSTINSLKLRLECEEKKIIQEAYELYQNTYKVADALAISQSTAHRLINKYCKT